MNKVFRHNASPRMGLVLQYMSTNLYMKRMYHRERLVTNERNEDNWYLSKSDKDKIERPYGNTK